MSFSGGSVKYFSMFTGVGGFELGINKAWRDTIQSKKENTQYTSRDKPISAEFTNQTNIRDCGNIESTKNTSGTLFQNGQEQSNSSSNNMDAIEENSSNGQSIRQGSNDILRKGNDLRSNEEILLKSRNSTNISNRGQPICVGFSEIDKYSSELLKNKWPEVKNYGDATKIKPEELPDFELLVGGFPCQAFSVAGARRGFEDTRGTLFFEIARIIKVKQPRLFVLENVKGLLNHDGGNTFTTILKTIDELGYDAEWQVLNSKHFGVPQNRERVFIVGHLRGERKFKIFPLRQHNKSFDWDKSSKVSGTVIAQYAKNPTDGTYITAMRGRNPENPTSRVSGLPTEQRLEPNLQGTSNCLSTVQKDNLVVNDYKIRRLTPLECERLQGFPDGWTERFSDTQRYKMMGNAVTVNVVYKLFRQIFRAIER